MPNSTEFAGSPEAVAYRLLRIIMRVENKTDEFPEAGVTTNGDRAYILNLYAECLLATSGKRPLLKPRK